MTFGTSDLANFIVSWSSGWMKLFADALGSEKPNESVRPKKLLESCSEYRSALGISAWVVPCEVPGPNVWDVDIGWLAIKSACLGGLGGGRYEPSRIDVVVTGIGGHLVLLDKLFVGDFRESLE